MLSELSTSLSINYLAAVKAKLVLYGLVMALLILGLRFMEYRLIIHNHSFEIYAGFIAILFMALGIYAGRKLTRPKEVLVKEVQMAVGTAPQSGEQAVAEVQLSTHILSKREYEVLLLMAEGLSNQEIADRSFVSLPTVKTHVSNILFKLDAKRRTQAVIKARELKIIS